MCHLIPVFGHQELNVKIVLVIFGNNSGNDIFNPFYIC